MDQLRLIGGRVYTYSNMLLSPCRQFLNAKYVAVVTIFQQVSGVLLWFIFLHGVE